VSATGDRPPAVSVRLRYSPGPAIGEVAALADDLGLHGVWVSEPWGFDAGPVLGWLAARTRRVALGTHVASVYARTPAATAGLAASLATISGGRFRLGLGTSGPQVVEGWHGVPFDRPLGRTRDVVSVVRQALCGEAVELEGETLTVPLPGGRGRPLRFSQLDAPIEVPIFLAALGPRNQRLTAEIADGWTPTPYSPDAHDILAADLAKALAEVGRVGHVRLAPVCPLAVGDDLDVLHDLERGWSALYLGGMGPADQNFYARLATRMGHGPMVEAIQERWQAGDRRGAKAAVDADYVDGIGLFGSPARIRERLQRYTAAGIDELVVELRKPDLDDQLADLRALWAVVTA
jgi:F420-dependent oxidoreductase-like protein